MPLPAATLVPPTATPSSQFVPSPHTPPERGITATLALILPLWAAGCADGQLVVLGENALNPFRFSEPRLLSELATPAKTDNPPLPSDLLELFFTSERGTSADVYVAQRSAPSDAFGPPKRVDAVSSDALETSPIVSTDGLTLYWASDRAGGLGDLDIWRATRSSRSAAWSAPENLRALNSDAKDLPRLPGQHQQIMPLSSDRQRRNYYAILFARWNDNAQAYVTPEPVPELSFERSSTVDAFLTDDGFRLFYVNGPSFGPADIFVASRRSTADAFEHFAPLEDINTASDERDPWLSADGSTFFFSSDRSGQYAIYEARLRLE